MRRTLALALAVVASLSLAACATVQKLGAAGDVHALLISIRDNDRAAFEAHVDRPALKRAIQAKLEARVGKQYGGVAALLAPGLAELAGETLVQPAVFRQVARQYGYGSDTKIPSPVVIAQALKPLADGRVCAVRNKDGPCTLVFSKSPEGVWKLSGFEGDVKDLKIGL